MCMTMLFSRLFKIFTFTDKKLALNLTTLVNKSEKYDSLEVS